MQSLAISCNILVTASGHVPIHTLVSLILCQSSTETAFGTVAGGSGLQHTLRVSSFIPCSRFPFSPLQHLLLYASYINKLYQTSYYCTAKYFSTL